MTWWRRLSLRTRLMLVGAGGLAAGLALAGIAVLTVLTVTLQRSVDAEATRTGEDVAALINEGALPAPVPVAGEQRVQVVDGQDRVLAASIGADRLVPMLREAELARVRDGERVTIDGERIGIRGPVRVLAVLAGEQANQQTVLVAKPMADLRESVQRVRSILLVAFPLLMAVLAAIAWRVVGAVLRPVEALRKGAAEITAAGRPASLPVPASRDEIYRLAVTLNDMLERLDAARAQQRAFVADAAHELRSPLANMRTELEVAQRLSMVASATPPDWRQVGADLLADTERLARLVDDLLLLARADDVRARQRRSEPVELSGLLRAVAERYAGGRADGRITGGRADGRITGGRADGHITAGRADGHITAGRADGRITAGRAEGRITVSVVESEPLWTEGEPEALRRVVSNLVDNAVRHATSSVVLAAVPEGDRQLVTVTDDGPGIPAADRERVFDRFTRLDDARDRDAGGAGLGLAIARELVHRHGGTIRLADAGPGLRAEVRLPPLDEWER